MDNIPIWRRRRSNYIRSRFLFERQLPGFTSQLIEKSLSVIVGFLLYRIAQYLQTRRLRTRLAKKWNCLPPVKSPLWDLLGLKWLQTLGIAYNEGRMLEHLREQFDLTSKIAGRPVHTFRYHVLHSEAYITRDAGNIQAMLATQFNDFGLGPVRQGVFAML